MDITAMQPKIVFEPVAEDDIRYIHCKVLIVCEGEKTEPNYFRSFAMMKNPSGVVYEIECDGGGINTLQVVEKAIELRDKAIAADKSFDTVWAVFDKDSFKDADFDNAIFKAEANNIRCAWSNEAFELWYIYHFDARCTPMSRNKYKETITKRVVAAGYKEGKKSYVYKKNDPNMRRILSECSCCEKQAIKRARNQVASFLNRKYHSHNPCTTVCELVNLLIGEDKDFIRKIKRELEKKD